MPGFQLAVIFLFFTPICHAELSSSSTVQEVAEAVASIDGYRSGALRDAKVQAARDVLDSLVRYYSLPPAEIFAKAYVLRENNKIPTTDPLKILDILEQTWIFGSSQSPQQVKFEEALAMVVTLMAAGF